MISETELQRVSQKETPQRNPLEGYIRYLDRNWFSEGLTWDWYNINNVGFSMEGQMKILTNPNYPKSIRAEQTGRDLLGFALEYLRRGTVFPFEYEIQGQDLIDPKYGRKRLIDTVKENERGGAVKDSLRRIQSYLLGGDERAAIMVSPKGWTGLTMDDGREIVYLDTQIYHMQRVGTKVIGTTLRTDFSLSESRNLLNILTGQDLSSSLDPKDYVRAIALLGRDSNLNKAENLVSILKQLRPGFSYKEKTWDDMERDVERRERLYDFDRAMQETIYDFKSYFQLGFLTDLEIRKALAASFFRISRYFVEQGRRRIYETGSLMIRMTQGEILDEVRKLPGCAGGGGTMTSVDSITQRSGRTDDEQVGVMKCVKCPFCNEMVDAILTKTKIVCPKCTKTADRSQN